MGRKTWVKPMTLVQKFEANEPVAAANCYSVACSNDTYCDDHWLWINKTETNSPYGNLWVKKEGTVDGGLGASLPLGFNHKGTCSHAENNTFRIDGMSVEFINEIQDGDILSGGFDNKVDVNNDGVIGPGDVIYWHTTVSPAIRYNHWGYVEPLDLSRPNHS